MNILFTGLNSLIGSHLACLIGHSSLANTIDFFSFIRSPSYLSYTLPARSIAKRIFYGSCDSVQDLASALHSSRPNLIVHMAQHKYTPNLLSALSDYTGTCSLLIVGTTGVFSRFRVCSDEYLRGEDMLLQSGYDFCLVRPSMIFGSPHDKNIHRLYDRIRLGKPIFLPRGGKSLFQPVYYKDISRALFLLIQRWLGNSSFADRFVNLPGPDVISLLDICYLLSSHTCVATPRFIAVPDGLSYIAVKALSSVLGENTPVTPEQIKRLGEDKVFSPDWDKIDSNFLPTHFADGIQLMIDNYTVA